MAHLAQVGHLLGGQAVAVSVEQRLRRLQVGLHHGHIRRREQPATGATEFLFSMTGN